MINKKYSFINCMIFFIALFVCYVGYFESVESEWITDKEIRAIIIVFFVSISIWCLIKFRKIIKTCEILHLLMVVTLFVGMIIPIFNGGWVNSLSTALRMILFIIVSVFFYNAYDRVRGVSPHEVGLVFLFLTFFFAIQTAVDVFSGGGIFMNGSMRYYGSIGSPIGFAACCFVLVFSNAYFFLSLKRNIYLFAAILSCIIVVMTATRSITVSSFFVLNFAVLFSELKKRNKLIVLMIPLFIYLIGFFNIIDIGVMTRAQDTIQASSSLDGSSSFRVFILDSFFSNVSFNEIFSGLGLGQFNVWFESQAGVQNVAPHFEFLWILSEFGIFTFFAYFAVGLLYLGFSVYRFFSKKIDFPEFYLNVVFLLTPQVFLQLANSFYFYQFVFAFAIISGVALSENKIYPVKLSGRI